jgi:hypothetical protein
MHDTEVTCSDVEEERRQHGRGGCGSLLGEESREIEVNCSSEGGEGESKIASHCAVDGEQDRVEVVPE